MIYCRLKLSNEAIKLLIKTKGDIPISYMHCLNENWRQANEIEQLQKITQDYSYVKKIISENEQVKQLANNKDQQIRRLTDEHVQFAKLAKEKDQEITQLKKENALLKAKIPSNFTGHK